MFCSTVTDRTCSKKYPLYFFDQIKTKNDFLCLGGDPAFSEDVSPSYHEQVSRLSPDTLLYLF